MELSSFKYENPPTIKNKQITKKSIIENGSLWKNNLTLCLKSQSQQIIFLIIN